MAHGEPEPIESIAITDITATEIDHIEDLGHGMRRIVFTTPHQLPSGASERHVCAKLIIPADCLEAMALKLNEGAFEAIDGVQSVFPKRHPAG